MKRWATDMTAALLDGNSREVLSMLKSGFPPSTPLTCRVSAEEVAVKTYCSHIAAQFGLVAVLRELAENGETLETKDSEGRTPFLVACKFGEFEAIRFLALRMKVNTGVKDLKGNTAVHLAALAGHKEIVEYLIEDLQFPYTARNNQGQLPVDLCVSALTDLGVNNSLEETIAYLKTKRSPSISPERNRSRKLSVKVKTRPALTPLSKDSSGESHFSFKLRSATPIDRLIRDRCKAVFTSVASKRTTPVRRLQPIRLQYVSPMSLNALSTAVTPRVGNPEKSTL